MIINMFGGLVFAISIGSCITAGVPHDDARFTRRHRLMLTMALVQTVGLILITH